MPGYEVNLLYIAALVALIFSGAGACSIEQMRHGQRREAAAIPQAPEVEEATTESEPESVE